MVRIWVILTSSFNPPKSLFSEVFPIGKKIGESWEVTQQNKARQLCRVVITINPDQELTLRGILTQKNVYDQYGVVDSGPFSENGVEIAWSD